jgi:hypothetical protein
MYQIIYMDYQNTPSKPLMCNTEWMTALLFVVQKSYFTSLYLSPSTLYSVHDDGV